MSSTVRPQSDATLMDSTQRTREEESDGESLNSVEMLIKEPQKKRRREGGERSADSC